MRAVMFVAVLVGCSDESTALEPLSGELAYVEVGSGTVRRMDVETGTDRVIAPGVGAGSIVVSRDGQYIAHLGLDMPPKVIGMDGSVTDLEPQGLCAEPEMPHWGPNNSLSYESCTAAGIVFYAGVGAPARRLDAVAIVQPADGAWLAYVDSTQGDLIVESPDASGRRSLGRFENGRVAALTPDEQFVIVADEGVVAAVRISDGEVIDLGEGGVPRNEAPLDARLLFSRDGSELLVARARELDAVTFATGARRPIATDVPDQWYVSSAAFIDATHVAYQRAWIDDDVVDAASQRFTVEVAETEVSFEGELDRPCQLDLVNRDAARVYVSCEGGHLVSAAGATITTHPTLTAVGIVEGAVLGYTATGQLITLSPEGTTTPLARFTYAGGADFVEAF